MTRRSWGVLSSFLFLSWGGREFFLSSPAGLALLRWFLNNHKRSILCASMHGFRLLPTHPFLFTLSCLFSWFLLILSEPDLLISTSFLCNLQRQGKNRKNNRDRTSATHLLLFLDLDFFCCYSSRFTEDKPIFLFLLIFSKLFMMKHKAKERSMVMGRCRYTPFLCTHALISPFPRGQFLFSSFLLLFLPWSNRRFLSLNVI